jgi:hypothetical protein
VHTPILARLSSSPPRYWPSTVSLIGRRARHGVPGCKRNELMFEKSACCARLTFRLRAVLAGLMVLAAAAPASAQFGGYIRQVAGVWIDADGLLRNRETDETEKVRAAREKALQAAPGDAKALGLRKISLRRLEAAIAEHRKTGTPLDDEIRYLAGLQHVQYVFVYPEQHDIVLAGPGEGWKIDAQGEVVGLTTGRPVMWLDDLIVSLRTAIDAEETGISCSIDPSDEGILRLRSLVPRLVKGGTQGPEAKPLIEETLGLQKISVTGIPGDSHFARVIVAADYRMKRLAMGFESAPIKGLPSFLSMMTSSRAGMQNMLPRWWLEPNYETLLASPDGLGWELRGASVKAVTEEDFVTESGARKRSGKANPLAQKWADNMTAHYDELAAKEPVFGQLRNCIDLAVVGALIVKDQLGPKAGYSMAGFLFDEQLPGEQFDMPKQVASQASLLKKGQNWLISCSGGVLINSWKLADKTEPAAALAPVRDKAAPAGENWWWN